MFGLHGHFYQPPREDPATGVMAHEPSAAPFHDWNERITAECYRPNGWARVVDERGRIVVIVNNFEVMSFDLAPTLARWMAVHAPDVLERIVAADRSANTAIAHPFHHVILPFATPRDRATELLWGRTEFEHRFGRRPLGVWLPETAMDSDTIAAVTAAGYRFTIALPHQVSATATVVEHRGCRIVVADDVLSRQLAFGVFGGDADAVIAAAARSAAARGHALATTDGETFGHHHKWTERTVAFALGVQARRLGWQVGSFEGLVGAPAAPSDVVASAWSCAHGLERWRSDCGCRNGDFGVVDQRWRGPLRTALEAVRDVANLVFDTAGREVFVEPWLARDDYASVLCDASETEPFMQRHGRAGASSATALALLESQRHALGMFTSCAWFFDDIGRLESKIAMRIAAECLRQLQLAGHGAAATAARQTCRDALAATVSHDPTLGTGADIWDAVLREERTTNAPIMARPDVQLIERAIAGVGIDDPTAWARRASGAERDRAQELVYEALATGERRDLDSVGEALGLAVAEISRRRRVGATR